MANTEQIWLLEHRRSTLAEGRRSIFSAGIPASIFAIILALLWSEEGEEFLLGVVAFLMLVTAAVALHVGRLNIRAAGTFICRLSRERLECHSPVPQCGGSFSISISDVDRLESSSRSEGVDRLYIWDKFGRRYELTYNYKNPADQFFDMIQELNPEIEVERT